VLSRDYGLYGNRVANRIQGLISHKRKEYRFIGISLAQEGIAEYIAIHKLDIPMYTGLDEGRKKGLLDGWHAADDRRLQLRYRHRKLEWCVCRQAEARSRKVLRHRAARCAA
jgi:hypothetical protein